MNAMNCWHCGNKVIWNNDHTFEDYALEGDGIVTSLSCSVCNAEYLIYLGENDGKSK